MFAEALAAVLLAAWLLDCAAPAHHREPPRSPTPGVAASWFPSYWQAPAILCARPTRLVYMSTGWGCQ